MAVKKKASKKGPKRTTRKVQVELSGGLRRGAVAVEAQGIPLKKSGSSWKGDERIELESPEIDFRGTFKGARHASFKVEVKINGKSKTVKGTITKGIKQVSRKWKFSDFGL